MNLQYPLMFLYLVRKKNVAVKSPGLSEAPTFWKNRGQNSSENTTNKRHMVHFGLSRRRCFHVTNKVRLQALSAITIEVPFPHGCHIEQLLQHSNTVRPIFHVSNDPKLTIAPLRNRVLFRWKMKFHPRPF